MACFKGTNQKIDAVFLYKSNYTFNIQLCFSNIRDADSDLDWILLLIEMSFEKYPAYKVVLLWLSTRVRKSRLI